MSRHPAVFPLPWFAARDYSAARAVLGTEMPETHPQWSELHDQIQRQIIRQGASVRRVPVRPAAFADWCRLAGRDPDDGALSIYIRRGRPLPGSEIEATGWRRLA